MSRNRQRKALYAAQADKSSRNEQVLDWPVVGRFVTVTEETRTVVDDDTGEVVRQYTVKCAPYKKIVHTDGPDESRPDRADGGRSTNARRLRRQIAAWSRCLAARGHSFAAGSRNCSSCGCPSTDQLAQAQSGKEAA